MMPVESLSFSVNDHAAILSVGLGVLSPNFIRLDTELCSDRI